MACSGNISDRMIVVMGLLVLMDNWYNHGIIRATSKWNSGHNQLVVIVNHTIISAQRAVSCACVLAYALMLLLPAGQANCMD